MKPHAIICLVLAALAVDDTSAQTGKPESQGPKILAKASWESNQLAARTGFIRDAKGAAALFEPFTTANWDDPATQKKATAKFAKVFKVDTIDWSKQMVFLAEAGRARERMTTNGKAATSRGRAKWPLIAFALMSWPRSNSQRSRRTGHCAKSKQCCSWRAIDGGRTHLLPL